MEYDGTMEHGTCPKSMIRALFWIRVKLRVRVLSALTKKGTLGRHDHLLSLRLQETCQRPGMIPACIEHLTQQLPTCHESGTAHNS